MAGVEDAAGREGTIPSLLHKRGTDLNAATLSSTDVHLEKQLLFEEATQKGLHDRQEIVLSPAPPLYSEPDIRKVTDVLFDLNYANETSSDLNGSSNDKCEKRLEVPAASTSDGTARGSDGNGDTEVAAVVSDGAAQANKIEAAEEKSTTATNIVGAPADAIVNDGTDAAKHSAHVPVPPTVLDVVQRHGGSTVDGHGEASEIENEPAVVFEREVTEVLEESDATEALLKNNSDESCIFVLDDTGSEFVARNDDISKTGFEAKFTGADLHDGSSKFESRESNVEVSSNQAANIDFVDSATTISRSFSFTGLNHVAFCVENLERSLDFYCGLLGLKTNINRPELPYRGAWLFLGAEGIHIMEVPNPDPVNGRPAHGGFDRHACLNCKNVEGVRLALERAGTPYQLSIVPSLFTRDPDGNGLEFIEVDS